MSGSYTLDEVSKHNTAEDAWVIIDGLVYDVTKFAPMHPAGSRVLTDLAGTDVTKQFFALHRLDILRKYNKRLCIGKVEGAKSKISLKTGQISRVPFAEHGYWQGFVSPFYNESHIRFRKAVREFVAENIEPNVDSWERMGKEIPKKVFEKMGAAGILAANLGPGEHLVKAGIPLPGGVKPEEFDYYHEAILHEEMYRIGAPGLSDGLGCGLIIGLPPVFKFGSKELAARVVPECLSGSKRCCLAISEPYAGSDVSNVQCKAVKSECGTYYTVTGIKKWITNGLGADYFSTAVRTGPDGAKGVSMLLIERGEGVTTKKIPTNYSSAAGTSLVIFEGVKVPVANLLGKENDGFRCIMHNFNHERWFIAVISVICARRCIEETMKWCVQRRAFGKPLISQPVIRAKLAKMLGNLESGSAYLDSLTYQMCNMDYKKQNMMLGGPIALLKLSTCTMNEDISNEAAQIFGGRGLTQGGMGKVVNKYRMANQFNGILGGTNEVLGDLAVRQAAAMIPKNSKL